MGRTYQGIFLVVILLLLAYYSSWMTRVLTVFVGLVVVRCNLKASEVSKIFSAGFCMNFDFLYRPCLLQK